MKAQQPRQVGLVVYFMQNLRLKGRPPLIIFARIVRTMNALQLCRWQRVGDFLLVLIELFLLGRTVEALRAVIGSKSAISLQRGPVDPKFQV